MAQPKTTNKEKVLGSITSIIKTETDYTIRYQTGELAKLSVLNSHVFRYYMSSTGNFLDYPLPNNPDDVAKINVKKVTDYDKKAFEFSFVEQSGQYYVVNTNKIKILFDKINGTVTVHDRRTNKDVLKEYQALAYEDSEATQILHQRKDEYFFGGGMQNGRFSHKGEVINIVNTNDWVDGGVASPCPFYWSSYGYGVLRNTWQPGVYDFGSKILHTVETTHKGEDFDVFYFFNSKPKDILNDYYELTGRPIFMPEYAFYEAHLNTFNRDYWVKVDPGTPGAILFEDGKYYKSYQPNGQMSGQKGILESLNGENNNYQFSARAMIDRYKRHDMPLGWFVPNDGYGSGYGQTDSLDGDIKNLKKFAEYARENGVEVALWTESNLEPKDPKHPKKGERDLNKEIGVAGTVALKCDVAWIGCGYSFGLNAVENAAHVFVKEAKHKIRPMIIMVDGWAGTQRYSGIWSGDQTGGEWEYIRFHIPTYIGAGLSGLPIVGSDMDGIYGGGVKEVNVRDYQWKAFTPLQLNMDGWGKIPKSPFRFDDEATTINRAYLKLKSMLMPYNYTIGYESTHGLPMIRAMFLEFPEESWAYTKDSQYQFMWGPSILVAPFYVQEESILGDIRNGVYLPNSSQVWIDFFTGEKYQGGKIYNNMKTPLWKIPVFIKDGAILPFFNDNNNLNEIMRDHRIFNLYPNDETSFNVYEDDGISTDYVEGYSAKTNITVIGPTSNEHGHLQIHINKTKGHYKKIVKERTTLIRIMATKNVENVKAAINGESIPISKVGTEEEFEEKENVYFFNENFIINPFLKDLGGDALQQGFLLIKIQKTDVIKKEIQIQIKGYANESPIFGTNNTVNQSLRAPSYFTALEEEITPSSIPLRWNLNDKAAYYEIERDGVIFSNIIESKFTFDGFRYESEHSFRIRSVDDNGVSPWSYYIIVNTKGDLYKNLVKGVKVSCNIPCQPSQEVCKLTDGDTRTLWHTHWDKPGQANLKNEKVIKLNFDLGNVYEIDKIEYTPREDAGNGTFLQINYRYSIDGKEWSPPSPNFYWEPNKSIKTIALNGERMRYMEFNVFDTISGFGSGKNMHFYKKNN